MVKYIIFSLILLLPVSCGSNIVQTKSQRDKGTLKESGFFDGKVDLEQPSMDLNASGNATILIGDNAIKTRMKTETEMKLDSDSAWDMSLDEAYKKFSAWVFIGLALAFGIFVFAWKQFEKSTAGRAFTTIGGELANMLKHSAPKSDEYDILMKVKDQLEQRKENFFKRG